MRTYITRRVLLLIPTFFLVTILVFLSVRFIPGDAIDLLMFRMAQSGSSGTAIDREKLERRLGLDVPAYVQYARWMDGILLHGDLGKPLLQSGTVGGLISGRLLVTIELGLVSILIGLLIGVPIGIYSAIKQNTLGDYVGRSFAIFGLATPNFWLATLILIFPAIWWGWSPPLRLTRIGDDLLAHLSMFITTGFDPGDLPGGRHDAHDAHDDAGGAPAGLHPHRLGQGAQRTPGHPAACHQERADPGGDPDWPAAALSDRRRGDHGTDVRHPGPRAADDRCAFRPGLPADLGDQPLLCHRGHDDQFVHRPPLFLPGSTHPV